jgi:2-polyprenyl-3-methyl-5-hydroxy-6-metoxy-1,4-benzoquinol methylase
MSKRAKWKTNELERVEKCVYCDAKLEENNRTIESKDWAFGVSEDSWRHLICITCNSLILSPRPKKEYIGRAYESYYTHAGKKTIINKIKDTIVNAVIKNESQIKNKKRCSPWGMSNIIYILFRRFIYISPDWRYIINSESKGNFLDVGCGSGRVVKLAKENGWNAYGIEADLKAVENAKLTNINVSHGFAESVGDYKNEFDLIYCSHVIEHVYEPKKFISDIYEALKPGGMAVIITPNAASVLRHYFGSYWRGLEAPRHISIPPKNKLIEIFRDSKFKVEDFSDRQLETLDESQIFTGNNYRKGEVKAIKQSIKFNLENCDITKLFCHKP